MKKLGVTINAVEVKEEPKRFVLKNAYSWYKRKLLLKVLTRVLVVLIVVFAILLAHVFRSLYL